MKSIKHIMAWVLSLVMILSIVVSSGVITASAVAGAGIQSTSYRAYGIDVSYWNVAYGSSLDFSRVNFAELKADGCQFVILRLGYEASASRVDTVDESFIEFYKRARAAGMPLGLYFYGLSTTKAGAIDDAQFVIKTIEENNMYFEYLGWCETLEAAGYFPGIYGGGSQVIDKLSSSFKTKYDLWYPRYKSNDEGNQHAANAYDFSDYCGMWQHAIFGYYDGLASSSVDMNVCYKDYPSIMKQYGYNNCTSPSRAALSTAIDRAEGLRHYPYSNAQITAIRNAYNTAVSTYNNTSSTDTACKNAADALNKAIDYTTGILSIGKSYTVSVNPRSDKWKDDGKRLTDGSRSNLPADVEAYSGLGTNPIEIVVDLGTSAGNHNNYGVYAAANAEWGISAPGEVIVSVSNDGKDFTEIASSTTVNALAQNGDWVSYYINVRADYNIGERYVKFYIIPGNGDHIWLDEVVVANSDAVVQNGIYVTGINQDIAAGDCHIFTPAFGAVSPSNGNIAYTRNVVAKWDSASSSYIVTAISSGTGTATPAITLSTGEILIAVHNWEGSSYENSVYGSAYNYKLLATVQVGDKIALNGIDVSSAKISPAAYVSIPARVIETPDDTTDTEIKDNLALGKTYTTVGLYSDGTSIMYPDENGKSLTNGKNAPADAKYNDTAFAGFNKNDPAYAANGYASITVDLGAVYSVDKFVAQVASSFNSSVGIYAPSYVSVYVSTDNKTFVEAGSVVPTDDGTVSVIAATIDLDKSVEARYVQFRLVAGTAWVFVTEVEVYEGAPAEEDKTDYIIGDVDADGKVDSVDYLLVKRACFNTYDLSDDDALRADVNEDEIIDSTDYLLIKRIAFGTYIA